MSSSTSDQTWQRRRRERLRAKFLRSVAGLQSALPSSGPKSWDSTSLNVGFSNAPEAAAALCENTYYGTSDHREFELFQRVRDSFKFRKRNSLILTSVAGGLFCYNLAVLLKPKQIYLFDINPVQLLLFELVKTVLLQSRDKGDFLSRLQTKQYDVHSTWERRLQDNLSHKMMFDGKIRDDKAFPGVNRRPLEHSWRYALNRFERLKGILGSTPQTLLVEDLCDEAFVDFVLAKPNNWIYLSNIWNVPERLQDSMNSQWSVANARESDTILSYSRPFRIRFRRYVENPNPDRRIPT